MKTLSIVVPLHNESTRLDRCMTMLLEWLASHRFPGEIVLVENGSTDDTLQKAHEWEQRSYSPPVRVLTIPERSKALAVRAGMLEARARYIYMADCDLSTPPTEIIHFLNAMDAGADVVIGSRREPGAQVRQSFKRRAVSWVFSCITGLVLPGIRDTQCGFKMFSMAAALNLFHGLRTTSMAFDVEILLNARRRGYKIVELPVEWSESGESRVRLVKDSFSMAMDVLALIKVERRPIPQKA